MTAYVPLVRMMRVRVPHEVERRVVETGQVAHIALFNAYGNVVVYGALPISLQLRL